MSLRGTFSQKIVDFVARERGSGTVLAVIELNDRTHNTTKDNKRDEMLREGGYKVIRWQSTAKPEATAIREVLLATSLKGAASRSVSKAAMARAADRLS